MLKRFSVLFVVLVASALVISACATPAPAAEEAAPMAEEAAPTVEAASALSGQLQLAGSTTVQPLAEVWSEAFMETNPEVTIDVQAGGSSVGVTSAGEGTVDIGMASRELKESEMTTFPDMKAFIIAYDGIAIVVNKDIDLPTLTKDQILGIFTGEITNFKEVGGSDAPIQVVSREEGSGTRGAFEELALTGKNDAGEKVVAPITEKALLQQSNGQVRTIVAETPNTIAYLSFGFLDDSIKAVSVEGVEPSVENVKKGTYPIFRPLNLLTNGDPSPLAKSFIDFILGDDGQQVVLDEGYMTVK